MTDLKLTITCELYDPNYKPQEGTLVVKRDFAGLSTRDNQTAVTKFEIEGSLLTQIRASDVKWDDVMGDATRRAFRSCTEAFQ